MRLGVTRSGTKRDNNLAAAPLLPLKLEIIGAATKQERDANVTATLERGYTSLKGELLRHTGPVHVCGSGPSFRETWREIPEGEATLAVNSAIPFLIERGRAPTWAMIWDAAEVCTRFAVPHADTHYLIGARCHPAVFERLAGCRVTAWHAAGDHEIDKFLRERKVEDVLIAGGTAGVSRGIYLAAALGYTEFHLHGGDSCYAGDETHVSGSAVKEKDITVFVGGRWFRTTPEFCAQVEEFKLIYPIFSLQLGFKVHAHGDGMLQHVISIMKADEPRALATAIAISRAQSQPLEKEAV